MAAIFGTWIFIAALMVGIGLAFTRILRVESNLHFSTLFKLFWVGWCVCLGLLIIWHFFLPVNLAALIVLIGISLAGYLSTGKSLWKLLRSATRFDILAGVLIVAVAGVWIASLVLRGTLSYDTGLYHLQAIQWDRLYPIIPGLGNVQKRLAFNNTNFLYSALLEAGPWLNRSFYVSNSSLMFVFLSELLFHLYQWIRSRCTDRLAAYYAWMILPTMGWLYGLPTGDQLSGSGPDLVVFILGTLLGGSLLELLVNRGEPSFLLEFTALVGLVGMSVKSSFAALAAAALLIVLWLVIRNGQVTARGLFRILWFPLAVLLVWLGQNVVLSGYPLFPFPHFGMPVPWKIPLDTVIHTQIGIENWGRTLGKSVAVAGWNWLVPWIRGMDWFHKAALALGVLGLIPCALFAAGSKTDSRRNRLLYLAPPLAGLVFWFFTSPNPRFLGASPWILLFGLYLIVEGRLSHPLMVGGITAVIALILVLLYANHRVEIQPLVKISANPLPDKLIKSETVFRTYSSGGMDFYIPAGDTDQCWQAPVPCLSEENDQIIPIDPKSIRMGFMSNQSSQ